MSATAAWKIVKSWLGPEAISKLRFASKSEVQTYIGPEYLPPHMGGTVCYGFKMVLNYALKRCISNGMVNTPVGL